MKRASEADTSNNNNREYSAFLFVKSLKYYNTLVIVTYMPQRLMPAITVMRWEYSAFLFVKSLKCYNTLVIVTYMCTHVSPYMVIHVYTCITIYAYVLKKKLWYAGT